MDGLLYQKKKKETKDLCYFLKDLEIKFYVIFILITSPENIFDNKM